MGGFEQEMFGGIDDDAFFLSISSPEDKNQIFFLLRQNFDDGVGETLPTLVLVGTGLMRPDCQSGI